MEVTDRSPAGVCAFRPLLCGDSSTIDLEGGSVDGSRDESARGDSFFPMAPSGTENMSSKRQLAHRRASASCAQASAGMNPTPTPSLGPKENRYSGRVTFDATEKSHACITPCWILVGYSNTVPTTSSGYGGCLCGRDIIAQALPAVSCAVACCSHRPPQQLQQQDSW